MSTALRFLGMSGGDCAPGGELARAFEEGSEAEAVLGLDFVYCSDVFSSTSSCRDLVLEVGAGLVSGLPVAVVLATLVTEGLGRGAALSSPERRTGLLTWLDGPVLGLLMGARWASLLLEDGSSNRSSSSSSESDMYCGGRLAFSMPGFEGLAGIDVPDPDRLNDELARKAG